MAGKACHDFGSTTQVGSTQALGLTVKFIEIFVLFGGGYLCGISCGSGFVFQALRKLFSSSWNPRKEALWIALAMPNILVCALMSVILIGVLVVGDQPGRQDFWPRAGWYACGLLVGVSLVFIAVHLINVGASRYHRIGEA